MKETTMSVFSMRDFADHEQVVFCSDDKSGLKAIIAVHNSNLGPALGGCRMWPYASEEEAVRDVLRLSRGMTYKSAMANLKLGGGKSVIIGNPRTQKTPELLAAFARAVERLNGRYIAAEDSGTSVEDMKYMAQFTKHVAGIVDKPTAEGTRSGDPSPATAYGTFVGIKAAVKEKLGRDSLEGLRVAVQGVGHVGFDLASQLKKAGATVWVTDIYKESLDRAAQELGATVVAPDEIFALDVDVFAPCALGAVLNDDTIPQLKAKIVAGAANNQLAEPRHGVELMKRGILYAPDYVINAGGIIDVYHERTGFDRDAVIKHIEQIYDNLMEIFARARQEERPTGEVADAIAEERFRR
jgi:leucine dehydrogenase